MIDPKTVAFTVIHCATTTCMLLFQVKKITRASCEPNMHIINIFFLFLQNKKEEGSSKEVFDEVLKQLESLGDKGKRVLLRLRERISSNENQVKLLKHIL